MVWFWIGETFILSQRKKLWKLWNEKFTQAQKHFSFIVNRITRWRRRSDSSKAMRSLPFEHWNLSDLMPNRLQIMNDKWSVFFANSEKHEPTRPDIQINNFIGHLTADCFFFLSKHLDTICSHILKWFVTTSPQLNMDISWQQAINDLGCSFGDNFTTEHKFLVSFMNFRISLSHICEKEKQQTHLSKYWMKWVCVFCYHKQNVCWRNEPCVYGRPVTSSHDYIRFAFEEKKQVRVEWSL